MNLKQFFTSILANGGGTYSFATGELNPTTGYFVSIQGHEKLVDANTFEQKDLSDFVYANSEELYKENRFIGAWVFEGEVYLDVSTQVTDKAKAIRIGMINNQKAIFDADNSLVINLPTMQRAGTESQKNAYIQSVIDRL